MKKFVVNNLWKLFAGIAIINAVYWGIRWTIGYFKIENLLDAGQWDAGLMSDQYTYVIWIYASNFPLIISYICSKYADEE